MKKIIKNIPVIGPVIVAIYRKIFSKKKNFSDSKVYWQTRYIRGGHSGEGSYHKLAEFKASVINDFVQSKNIVTVIEYGCGDGNQLLLANYPNYHGIDVSEIAVKTCEQMFKNDRTKKFSLLIDEQNETADLTLSLDVIYHLLEDETFDDYMHKLFDTSNRYVIIYSSNTNDQIAPIAPHVRHRKFIDWVNKEKSSWQLLQRIPNIYPYTGDDTEGSFADFYIFQKA